MEKIETWNVFMMQSLISHYRQIKSSNEIKIIKIM